MKYHKGAQLKRYMLSKILLILIMAAIIMAKSTPYFSQRVKEVMGTPSVPICKRISIYGAL